MTIAIQQDPGHELLRQMLRIRRFEEKCAELYQHGKIRGFLHLYIGEEAVAVGSIPAFGPEDAIVATYREHGHALVRGTAMGSLMAELYGKATGCARGRGGSMHFFDASRRFFGGLAIVAGGLPVAVGLALADKMQHRPLVTACYFGDGAVAEGEFHESLNLAALWKLPVVFLCENNLYAMGTALARHQSQTDNRWTAWMSWPWQPRLNVPLGMQEEIRDRIFLNIEPTGFVPTRCMTPSSTELKMKWLGGKNAIRSRRSNRSFA
jgi:TPP-dependent pyruvate/acetoin dehydrogenase alpha subunit